MITTKEILEKIGKINHTLICKYCGEKLKGYDAVIKHKQENWDHFEYQLDDSEMRLCFA